jgi:hypothetical protein
MIKELKQHCYNVCGVFFQNSCESEMVENRQIMLLDWDERYYILNSMTDNPEEWSVTLRNEAWDFCNHLLSKV